MTGGGADTAGGAVTSGGGVTRGGAETTGRGGTRGGGVSSGGAVSEGGAETEGGAVTRGGGGHQRRRGDRRGRRDRGPGRHRGRPHVCGGRGGPGPGARGTQIRCGSAGQRHGGRPCTRSRPHLAIGRYRHASSQYPGHQAPGRRHRPGRRGRPPRHQRTAGIRCEVPWDHPAVQGALVCRAVAGQRRVAAASPAFSFPASRSHRLANILPARPMQCVKSRYSNCEV